MTVEMVIFDASTRSVRCAGLSISHPAAAKSGGRSYARHRRGPPDLATDDRAVHRTDERPLGNGHDTSS